MGLEAPLALLGLLAVVLPWLAHRIRRRDLTPVALPTLQLLRKAEVKKRRSRGFADVLLLLVRMAILIAASLGLAAPYVTARLYFGDGSVASAAIVIDDSMSMQRTDGDEPLLLRAVDEARRAIDSLPEHSEVTVIGGGKPARVVVRRTSDLRLAQSGLDRLVGGPLRGNDLEGALKLAAQQLEAARNPTRRVLLLSDFATHTGLQKEDLQLDGVQVSLTRLGHLPPAANVYFKSVRALPDPSAKAQTSIAVELGAYGEAPERVPLRIESAGRELASGELSIVSGAAQAVFQVPTPGPETDPTALLTLGVRDALDADNHAGVLLRPSDAIVVMLVNGDPRPASDQDELRYARSALGFSEAAGVSLSVQSVDASALAKHDLTQVDVVVLANAEFFSPSTAARLARFVQTGGGLVVAMGDRVDPKRYNVALAEVLPCRLGPAAKSNLELAEPQVGKLFPTAETGLAHVKVREHVSLDCSGEVALRFSDGSPALAFRDVGRGRAAVLGTTIDADWTDLPLRPGYLPLLTRLIRDVARADLALAHPVRSGERVELAVPPDARSLEVVAPDGAHRTFNQLEGQSRVEYSQTGSPGPYRVLVTSERGAAMDAPRSAFVVEVPHEESDLSPLEHIEHWGGGGGQGHAGATVRRSLAAYVLMLFAALVLAEGVLRVRR